jgi:hypothetical protein
MKGYFGQLARRTGLSIGNQTAAARGSSTEPSVAAAAKTSAPVAPIHVEEVVFTASSPDAGADVSTGRTSDLSTSADVMNLTAGLATPNEVYPSPRETVSAEANQNASVGHAETAHHTADIPDTAISQETAPHESRVRFVAAEPETAKPATEQVFFDERPFAESARTVSVEPQPLTEETVTVESGAVELRQPDYETRASSVRPHEVQSVEIVNQVDARPPKPANAPEAPEREPRRIFQDQLKEVIAWITSPPEEVEQSTFEVVEMQHETSNVVIRERERPGSAERPSKASEPHVNDLSLSIGTISIVVEEPKQDFPVSIAPAPTTHTSPQPVAPEPTRLSRYYLRNL